MRLAVREAAADRRADAGRVLRVNDVHVEADVNEVRAGRMRERLAHAGLDAHAVDLAHREHLRIEPLQELTLTLIERANADEREPARLDGRKSPALVLERRPAEA